MVRRWRGCRKGMPRGVRRKESVYSLISEESRLAERSCFWSGVRSLLLAWWKRYERRSSGVHPFRVEGGFCPWDLAKLPTRSWTFSRRVEGEGVFLKI